MIRLDDSTYIDAQAINILKDLHYEYARKYGDVRFNKFIENGANIQTNCPFHKGGKESKPSFGVNGDINKCHCFTCGWSGSIQQMINELFAARDNNYGKNWLIRKYNTTCIEKRKRIDFFKSNKKIKRDIIPEDILDEYSEITEEYSRYLTTRGFNIDDDCILDFEIGFDENSKCITFPVRNLKGELTQIAKRSINSKKFYLDKDAHKDIYAADKFVSGKYKIAYITESVFNCLTLWKLGLPAMALLGTGAYEQYKVLNKLPVREYILALDPDNAGRKGTERFKRNVRTKILKEVKYDNNYEDINDLGDKFLKLPILFL